MPEVPSSSSPTPSIHKHYRQTGKHHQPVKEPEAEAEGAVELMLNDRKLLGIEISEAILEHQRIVAVVDVKLDANPKVT